MTAEPAAWAAMTSGWRRQDDGPPRVCSYCLAPAGAWDHVHPQSKGGTHDPDNLVPACIVCNSQKGDRSLLMFLYRRRYPDVVVPSARGAQWKATRERNRKAAVPPEPTLAEELADELENLENLEALVADIELVVADARRYVEELHAEAAASPLATM